MSDLLSIFPLPAVVLFPGVFLPLHIFEPRYREMVSDALATDRMIGLMLLRPGWEGDYEGRPAVFGVGCSAVMTHCEKLPDGRFNIILRGLDRFRILDEDSTHPYRRALSEPLPETPLTSGDRISLGHLRTRIEALLSPSEGEGEGGIDPRAAKALSDDDLVNALAQHLDFEPLEKQALLEKDSVLERGRGLVDLLEMRMLMARGLGLRPTVH